MASETIGVVLESLIPTVKKILLNLAIFQIGWMVCVLGGDLSAVAYTAVAIIVHHHVVLERNAEWRLISIVTVVGCIWDVLMVQAGMITYVGTGLLGIPLWLVCLWILFATTFMHALAWLGRYLWLAGLLAAVFGPASYWFGVELTDAYFEVPILTSLLVMALGWSTLFPAAIYLSRRYQS